MTTTRRKRPPLTPPGRTWRGRRSSGEMQEQRVAVLLQSEKPVRARAFNQLYKNTATMWSRVKKDLYSLRSLVHRCSIHWLVMLGYDKWAINVSQWNLFSSVSFREWRFYFSARNLFEPEHFYQFNKKMATMWNRVKNGPLFSKKLCSQVFNTLMCVMEGYNDNWAANVRQWSLFPAVSYLVISTSTIVYTVLTTKVLKILYSSWIECLGWSTYVQGWWPVTSEPLQGPNVCRLYRLGEFCSKFSTGL